MRLVDWFASELSPFIGLTQHFPTRLFLTVYFHHHYQILVDKLTKRSSVQHDGKISLYKLIHVFKQLSRNEVYGVRLNSQKTVMSARSQFIHTEDCCSYTGAEEVDT